MHIDCRGTYTRRGYQGGRDYQSIVSISASFQYKTNSV